MAVDGVLPNKSRSATMPEIKKAYVTIMVADLDKAVEFYNGILGLYEDLRFRDSWAEMTKKGRVSNFKF